MKAFFFLFVCSLVVLIQSQIAHALPPLSEEPLSENEKVVLSLTLFLENSFKPCDEGIEITVIDTGEEAQPMSEEFQQKLKNSQRLKLYRGHEIPETKHIVRTSHVFRDSSAKCEAPTRPPHTYLVQYIEKQALGKVWHAKNLRVPSPDSETLRIEPAAYKGIPNQAAIHGQRSNLFLVEKFTDYTP